MNVVWLNSLLYLVVELFSAVPVDYLVKVHITIEWAVLKPTSIWMYRQEPTHWEMTSCSLNISNPCVLFRIEGTREGHRRFKAFTCCCRRQRAPVFWRSSSSGGATIHICCGWPTLCSASVLPSASSVYRCRSKDGPVLRPSSPRPPSPWTAAAATATTATVAKWTSIISTRWRGRPVTKNAPRSSCLHHLQRVNSFVFF